MILTKHSRNTSWMSTRDVKGGSRSFTTLPPGAPSGTRTPNPLIMSHLANCNCWRFFRDERRESPGSASWLGAQLSRWLVVSGNLRLPHNLEVRLRRVV